jgi:hypothetical protein
MSRSFDVVTASPRSVAEIHDAFSREDYWLARLAGGAGATLDSLTVGDDGAVAVRLTQQVGRAVLPPMVAKVIPGDLTFTYLETWRPADDGHVRGDVRVSASGGLGSSRADNWLTPTGAGARLRSQIRVQVRIPLLGGQIEKSIGSGLAQSIPSVLRFTTRWIAECA